MYAHFKLSNILFIRSFYLSRNNFILKKKNKQNAILYFSYIIYFSLQQLRLWNGSLSFQYWQKPGVVRLTKVYIFNMTNVENFLQYNEKPKLQEIGPFVYK